MKKLFAFLKRLIFGGKTWKDVGLEEDSTPTPVGWHVPDMGIMDVEIALIDDPSTISVLYIGETNTVEVQSAGGDDVWEVQLTITTRIFTKVNNVLEKHNSTPISRELFDAWEDSLIEAQGKGKNTYHSKRHPIRKTK